MARPAHRPPNFKDPQQLIDLWEEYKAHVDKKPDIENVVTAKGDVVKKETKKPYLLQGYYAFVFKKTKKSVNHYFSDIYEEFSDAISFIRYESQEDQLTGSLTGRYKAPGLVAKLCALVDKTEVTQTTTINLPDGTIKYEKSDSEEHYNRLVQGESEESNEPK